MVKRNSPNDVQSWDDAQDLDRLINDKRLRKRATPANARRRNRRYGKQMLDTYLDNHFDDDLDLEEFNP
ncbi:MAG: hypothetical protein IGR76_07125 [Synechococcales cyanobacterium T60_A2020_003]|nr:hypothetical protein [Synechococcales cyanobacterium T60_A2020_003]